MNQASLQIQLMMKHSHWIICRPYHQEQGPELLSSNATVIPANLDSSSIFNKKEREEEPRKPGCLLGLIILLVIMFNNCSMLNYIIIVIFQKPNKVFLHYARRGGS